MSLRPFALAALIGFTALLSACGDNENAPGPGGVSVGEARALDDAAEMIEQQPSIPADAETEEDPPVDDYDPGDAPDQ